MVKATLLCASWKLCRDEEQLDEGYELVQQRRQMVQNAQDQAWSMEELERVLGDLKAKWIEVALT